MDSRVPSVRSLCNDMFEPLLCGGVTLEVISRAGQKGKIRLFASRLMLVGSEPPPPLF